MYQISAFLTVAEILQQWESWVGCVYLDFKMAFDIMSHNRLIWKLEHVCGVKGNSGYST